MKVKVNGVEIYYQKLGKGHPLILLHGHHQDGGIFDKLVAPLYITRLWFLICGDTA